MNITWILKGLVHFAKQLIFTLKVRISHARSLSSQETGLALHSEKITQEAGGIQTKWEKNKDRWLENLQKYSREKNKNLSLGRSLPKRKMTVLSDIIQLSENNN